MAVRKKQRVNLTTCAVSSCQFVPRSNYKMLQDFVLKDFNTPTQTVSWFFGGLSISYALSRTQDHRRPFWGPIVFLEMLWMILQLLEEIYTDIGLQSFSDFHWPKFQEVSQVFGCSKLFRRSLSWLVPICVPKIKPSSHQHLPIFVDMSHLFRNRVWLLVWWSLPQVIDWVVSQKSFLFFFGFLFWGWYCIVKMI